MYRPLRAVLTNTNISPTAVSAYLSSRGIKPFLLNTWRSVSELSVPTETHTNRDVTIGLDDESQLHHPALLRQASFKPTVSLCLLLTTKLPCQSGGEPNKCGFLQPYISDSLSISFVDSLNSTSPVI
jgi:hypothetical protein